MRVIFLVLLPKSSLIFLFREPRVPLAMQIRWIKTVKESKKPLAEYVCIHNPKLFGIELISMGYFTDALARILVYSMRVDGDIRNSTPAKFSEGASPLPSGYIAGSKAVESLDRLITSIEPFFHPSNTGQWTLSVGLSFL